MLTDQREFGFRRGFGEKIIYPGLGSDGGSGQPVVAGDHHRLDAHAAQFGETLLDAALDDIFEFDDSKHLGTIGDHQGRAATTGNVINASDHFRRKRAVLGFHMPPDGIG